MFGFIMLMILVSFVALVVGLIKPSLVIRWGDEEKKNRKTVLKLFLGIFLILLVLGVATNEPTAKKNTKNVAVSDNVENKQSENTAGKNVVHNEDGSITTRYSDTKSMTEYPDKTVLVIDGHDTKKSTGRYKSLDFRLPDLLEKEVKDSTVYEKYQDMHNRYNDKGNIKRIALIARNNGIALLDERNSIIITGYKFNDNNSKEIEWCLKLISKSDIRKANPDLVAAEGRAILRSMARDLPEFSKFELTIGSGFQSNDLDEGDTNMITLTYYKTPNVVTEFLHKCQTVNGEKGSYLLWDVVQ